MNKDFIGVSINWKWSKIGNLRIKLMIVIYYSNKNKLNTIKKGLINIMKGIQCDLCASSMIYYIGVSRTV